MHKTIGQLVKDKHWSVQGLVKSINITKKNKYILYKCT